MKTIKENVQENVRKLMNYHGSQKNKLKPMTQSELAKKSGVSQRALSYLLEDKEKSTVLSIQTETIEKLANYFNIEPYHLLIPDQPIEELISKRIESVTKCYMQVTPESRENIVRISENEVRYSQNISVKSNGK